MATPQQDLIDKVHRYIKNRSGRGGELPISADEQEMWNRIFDIQRKDDHWDVDMQLVEAMAIVSGRCLEQSIKSGQYAERVVSSKPGPELSDSTDIFDFFTTIHNRHFLAFFFPAFIKEILKMSNSLPSIREAGSLYRKMKSCVVDTFCTIFDQFRMEHLCMTSHTVRDDDKLQFNQKCERLYFIVDLIANLMCLDWNRVEDLLQAHRHIGVGIRGAGCSSLWFTVCPDTWYKAFWFCFMHGEAQDVKMSFLSMFDRNVAYDFNTDLFKPGQLNELAVLCSTAPWQEKWQVYFRIRAKDKKRAEVAIKTEMQRASQDEQKRDILLVAAAQIAYTTFVKDHFVFCVNVDVVRRLPNIIDEQACPILCKELDVHCRFLMRKVRQRMPMRIHIQRSLEVSLEDRVPFALICIRQGLSTHYPNGAELCARCLKEKQPDLLRLFLKSGAVTYQQYYHCKENVTPLDQDVVDEVESENSQLLEKSVHRLEEMCVLLLSHTMGYDHDRLHRIDELELVEHVKDKIKFKRIEHHLPDKRPAS